MRPLARHLVRSSARRTAGAACEACRDRNAADHVHVVARHPPSVAVSDVVQKLKGASAHAMRAAVPHATGHLWQAGYWAESVGPFELPAVVASRACERAPRTSRAT